MSVRQNSRKLTRKPSRAGRSPTRASVGLRVYDPTGSMTVTQLFSPRLADLSGKIVCELSNGLWEAHRTFPFIRELLQKQFPTIKIIPYTEFPIGKDAIDSEEIVAKVRAQGGDAVLIGNAS